MDNETFKKLCEHADQVGKEAVEKLRVVPMIVGQETHPFSGVIDETKETYFVEDGVCGFAWVDVYPEHKGNTRLGKQERKVLEDNGFRKSVVGKNYNIWISAFDQSMQKKEAYADAYAKVLRDGGIKAYAGSRMD